MSIVPKIKLSSTDSFDTARLMPSDELPDALLEQIETLNAPYNNVFLDHLENKFGPRVLEFLEQGRACIFEKVPAENGIDNSGAKNIALQVIWGDITARPITEFSNHTLLLENTAAHELGIKPFYKTLPDFASNALNKLFSAPPKNPILQILAR